MLMKIFSHETSALSMPSALFQPWVACRVGASVIRVEVDKHPLDFEVPDLKNIAPASGVRNSRAPLRAARRSAVARPLDHDRVTLADIIEVGVVVADRRQDA